MQAAALAPASVVLALINKVLEHRRATTSLGAISKQAKTTASEVIHFESYLMRLT